MDVQINHMGELRMFHQEYDMFKLAYKDIVRLEMMQYSRLVKYE